MKYDFELNMATDNSNSLILREIKEGTSVLEFGPAHGRMTKYLKENLNCFVSIVEKDRASGEEAARFCDTGFIGDEFGDIEKYNWHKDNNIKYDYIIFADVLEHLYDPWAVLSKAKELLKDDGSVLISVPNVAYNGIIIDLLHDKFKYREIGLLDNTHIRFFTAVSLQEMIISAGFKINKVMDVKCGVEYSELKNSYYDVPLEFREFLQKRKYGEVYQFIWELHKR